MSKNQGKTKLLHRPQQEAISSGDGDSQTFPLKKSKLEVEEHDNLEGTLSTCDHSNTGVWLQHKIQLSLKDNI